MCMLKIVLTIFISCSFCPAAMSKAKKITTPKYIRWLEERSMLGEAEKLFPCVSGNGIQWDSPYAIPQTEKVSRGNIPRAKELYGSLPEQLKDPDSFASRIKNMLVIREKYGIALAKRIEIPEVQNKGVVIMVHKLPRSNEVEITALNFGRDKAEENLKLDILSSMTGCDVLNKGPKIKIPGSGELPIELGALEGKVLVFSNPL